MDKIEKCNWQPLEAAPRDGSVIEGLYGEETCLIRWAETRRCMLAGIGGGNGYFGPGWEDDYNGLIADEPDAWRVKVPECFMCQKPITGEPIPLLRKPRVVCSEECLSNYSWGLDFT